MCEINKYVFYNLNIEYKIIGVVFKIFLIINFYEVVYIFWRKFYFYEINKIYLDVCIGWLYNWILYSL